MFSNSRSGGQASAIILEDDDDDVRVSSPRSVAQARSYAFARFHRPVHIPVLDDEDLELRLGPAGLGPAVTRSEPSVARLDASAYLSVHTGLSLTATIDLTNTNNSFKVKHTITGKQNQWQLPPEPPKELKLTCAICMDTMKEETSTVCGHIFCKQCIMTAMQAQKKCPTCRRKLGNNQIHRIYISESTS